MEELETIIAGSFDLVAAVRDLAAAVVALGARVERLERAAAARDALAAETEPGLAAAPSPRKRAK